MDMEICFPGGQKVDALFRGFTIKTDQSREDGGDNTAPTPFALFLASIGTCVGGYALSFCESRKIGTERLQVGLDFHRNPKTHMVEKIVIQIKLPPGFPERYQAALIRSVRLCFVKRHMDQPPEFQVLTQAAE